MNATLSAVERLAASRECLRLALYPVGTATGFANLHAEAATGTHWLTALKATPAARLLLDAAQGWWARQPVRLLVPLAAQATQVVLAPVAQRHPVGLVLGAAAVGATLVMARPWRWISAAALLARFLPPLLSEVVNCAPAASCYSPQERGL